MLHSKRDPSVWHDCDLTCRVPLTGCLAVLMLTIALLFSLRGHAETVLYCRIAVGGMGTTSRRGSLTWRSHPNIQRRERFHFPTKDLLKWDHNVWYTLFTLLSSYLSSPEFTRSVHTGKLPERMVSIIFLLAAGKI